MMNCMFNHDSGVGEIIWWLQCLLKRHEDWSLHGQNPQKSMMAPSNYDFWRQRHRVRRASWLVRLDAPRNSDLMRGLPPKNRWRSDGWWFLISTWGLPTPAHVHMYMCTHTYAKIASVNTHTCMCTHVHVCIHMQKCAPVHTHIHLHLHRHTCTCVHIHTQNCSSVHTPKNGKSTMVQTEI